MANEWIGPAISATASTVGSILGATAQATASKDSIRYQNSLNRENAEWAQRVALQNWQMENAYNSPANQMKRLQEAGLNPNLIYGNGTTSTGIASPLGIPSHAAPGKPDTPNFGDFGMSDAVRAYTEITNMERSNELADSQLRTQIAQQNYYQSLSKLNDAKAARELFGKNIDEFWLNLDQESKDAIIAQRYANVANTRSQTSLNNGRWFESQANTALTKQNTANALLQGQILQNRLDMMPAEAMLLQANIRNTVAQAVSREFENDINDETREWKVATVQNIASDCLYRAKNGKIEFNTREFEYQYMRKFGVKPGASLNSALAGTFNINAWRLDNALPF